MFSAWVLMLGYTNPGYSQNQASLMEEEIESIASGKLLSWANEKIGKREWVVSFYRSINYQLAWNDEMDTAMLLALLQRADDEGLNHFDYHYTLLNHLYDRTDLLSDERVYFDILLTDAFMLYGSHLLNGKVDPVDLYPNEWVPFHRSSNLVDLLKEALQENGLAKAIDSLRPSKIGYTRLIECLKYYKSQQRNVQSSPIEQGVSIEAGTCDYRIPAIRKRLSSTTVPLKSDSTLYDSILLEDVKKFQRQYGLADDGVIGKHTIESFNYSPEYHVQKIVANLERYRWLPDDWSSEFILINIPAFELALFKQDSLVMKMKTIVGRPERKTPVFSNDIHYLILNPSWTVPPTILKEDVLPAVKRNVKYLERNNIRVFNRKGEEVDATLLPWATYTERNFPFQLRQDPGPNNSLGLIKFQLTNNFKVFLHDTNHRGLFHQTNRALSSGCIRIEHPLLLAQYLLAETEWTNRKIEHVIESGKTTTVVFPQPAIVHLVYFTAFVDELGMLQLRNDIYEWDEPLIDRLYTKLSNN